MPGGDLDGEALCDAVTRFHAAYEKLYGYSYRDTQLTEVVNVRVTGVGLIDKPNVAKTPDVNGSTRPEANRSRQVYFDGGFVDCKVYDRDTLPSGTRIGGPLVIEEYGSTTVVQAQQQAMVDEFCNLLLTSNRYPHASDRASAEAGSKSDY